MDIKIKYCRRALSNLTNVNLGVIKQKTQKMTKKPVQTVLKHQSQGNV